MTGTVGNKFTFDLMINSGSHSVTVAQSYITFTNSVLQLVDGAQPGCVITSVVSPDASTFDTVLQNETCNGPGNCVFRGQEVDGGSLAFASGALGTCQEGCAGDFRVAQVSFCGVAEGDALLHWQFSPPAPLVRDCEIVEANGSVVSNPALYQDYVIHVVSGNQMVGHVTWQARPPQPNQLQALPITLTLKSGDSEVNYSMQTTNTSGFFTISVDSLAGGFYIWRVKGPKYLANSGTVELAGVANTQVEMGLMRAGDCNDDNTVSVQDYNILKGTFGKQAGDPGYDDRGDFTGDQRVSAADFNPLKNNFGTGGAPPVSPGEARE
jgi:hypothetical protein